MKPAADANLFYSPLSIAVAFSMTYLGARGETAEELAEALDLEAVTGGQSVGKSDAAGEQERRVLATAAGGLLEKVRDLGTRGVSLDVANALFIHKDFQVGDSYTQL